MRSDDIRMVSSGNGRIWMFGLLKKSSFGLWWFARSKSDLSILGNAGSILTVR
jgi:hypothetical protein